MSELNGSFGQADGLVGTLGTDKSLTGYLVGGYGLSLTGQLGGSLIPGPKGDKGDKGDRGETGETGPAGPTGERGEKGDTGAQGPRGETGERGPTGETGAQGPQGEIGPAGPKGDTGEQGPKGDTGPAGPTGPQGVKGDPGDDYILTEQDKQDIAGLVGTPVDDVQINGTSIVSNSIAEIPIATYNNVGLLRPDNASLGINNGQLIIKDRPLAYYKGATTSNTAVVCSSQHLATFYGLAKVAGHNEKNSTLPVGTYTEEAKSSISDMLNGPVTVDGTAPVINAKSGVRYVCGECSTIDISTPESGIIDVTFTSGSTPTVLTVTPPEGMTMMWANNFDPADLDANTTYEINIMDGCKGVACSWT